MKSLRDGKANLVDSYARIQKGEAFLVNFHISPYAGANQFNHEPTRTRKLLLHGREIERLTGKTKERGLTLIPLKIYFKNGRAKVELGLARGKKLYDKRETLAPQSRPARSRALAQVAVIGACGVCSSFKVPGSFNAGASDVEHTLKPLERLEPLRTPH